MSTPTVPLHRLGEGEPKGLQWCEACVFVRSHQGHLVPALGYGAMDWTSYYGGIEKNEEVNRVTIRLVNLSCGCLAW